MPAPPKKVAVTITIPERKAVTYAQVLRTAREKIPLAEIGTKNVHISKVVTKGLIMEASARTQLGRRTAWSPV